MLSSRKPAPPPVDEQRELPRQLRLSGKINFRGHKASSTSTEAFFRNASAAHSVLNTVAAEYASVLAAYQRDGVPAAEWPLLSIEGHTSGEPEGHAKAVKVSKARAKLCADTVSNEMARLCPSLNQKALRARVVFVGFGGSRPMPGFGMGNHVGNRRVEVFLRHPNEGGAGGTP